MNIKYIFYLAAITLVVFTGCISKRPVVTIEVGGAELTDSNSRTVFDDDNKFSITLPNDYQMVVDMEDAGARLFTVNKNNTNPPEKKMYLEENPAPVETALSMFENEETVTVISNEDVVVNGYLGKKISVNLSYAPEPLSYYFLRAGNKTYVFSQSRGAKWEYFQPIVESFRLTQ